jgi:hypothetical protein
MHKIRNQRNICIPIPLYPYTPIPLYPYTPIPLYPGLEEFLENLRTAAVLEVEREGDQRREADRRYVHL